jgi:AcrR family transcriptional regulator
MQVNVDRLSPTASARRAQIVSATISVIATLGYNGASFSQIAKHAQLSSTRLISYHFQDKNELMSAVAEAVLAQAGQYLRERIATASGHPERLATYIRANLAFIGEHPQHIHAVIQIAANTRAANTRVDETRADETAAGEPGQAVALLVRELKDGQTDGDFRDFDPLVMAVSLRAAIDAAANLVTEHPELDLDAYAEQLVALFEHATRRPPFIRTRQEQP